MKSKHIILAASTLLASLGFSAALAAADGIYLGLQAGLAKTHYKPQLAEIDPSTVVTVTPKNNSYGGRLFGGYQFNEYAGLEAGYSVFSKTEFDLPAGVTACSQPSIRTHGFDVVGKGILPVSSNFSVFAKAGIMWAFVNQSDSLIAEESPSGCDSKSSNSSVHPVFGAGVSYALNQNWEADLSWTRIMKGNNLSNVDFFAVGISYHFVDRYCGQFLC